MAACATRGNDLPTAVARGRRILAVDSGRGVSVGAVFSQRSPVSPLACRRRRHLARPFIARVSGKSSCVLVGLALAPAGSGILRMGAWG